MFRHTLLTAVSLVLLSSHAWADTSVKEISLDVPRESPTGVPYRLVFAHGNKAHVATTTGDAENLLGKTVAKQLKGKVDFKKQQLVAVVWKTTGHPDSRATFVIQGDKRKAVSFKVERIQKKGPVPQLFMAHIAFFLVDRNLDVNTHIAVTHVAQ